jgi:formylglycine-generating enzyme
MKFKLHLLLLFFLTVSIAGLLAAQPATYTNSIGMQFVSINPGEFVSGMFQPPFPKPSSESKNGYTDQDYKLAEELARRDARPGFTVQIKKAFYIGKFEVTQSQWKEIMGTNPSVFQGDKVDGNTDQYPVENVTWKDVQVFIKKLNQKEGSKVKYRLPTEFEWEYAARAGAKDDIPWTQIRLSAQLGTRTTNKVGEKQPNAWGLYDMLGNVWEWVQDFYNEKIFADPIPPKVGKEHVLKGASFVGDVKNATYMTHAAGPGNGWDVGFRLIMEVNAATINNSSAQAGKIPEGFTNIFNKENLKGWHISRTTHQGTTPDFSVRSGEMILKQNPYGQGGVLLTDKKYKNFELYLEVKVDSFCNGGIFLRSTESGQAYQVELSEPGGTGNLFGEMLSISKSAEAKDKSKVWKPNDWNFFRIRMVGDVPRITLWINGVQMWDVQQPANDFTAGATEGMIGLQAHWSAPFSTAAAGFDMSGSWKPGTAHRYRNIAIKEL